MTKYSVRLLVLISQFISTRRYATSKKVGFHLAKMIISRALRGKETPVPSARAIEEPPRSVNHLCLLCRLKYC